MAQPGAACPCKWPGNCASKHAERLPKVARPARRSSARSAAFPRPRRSRSSPTSGSKTPEWRTAPGQCERVSSPGTSCRRSRTGFSPRSPRRTCARCATRSRRAARLPLQFMSVTSSSRSSRSLPCTAIRHRIRRTESAPRRSPLLSPRTGRYRPPRSVFCTRCWSLRPRSPRYVWLCG